MNDINGCGGKGSWLKPPYKIFFKTSCNKHDELYTVGGNEYDRYQADTKFIHLLLLDCYAIKNKYKRTYYQLWAIAYYLVVRNKGNKFFNYYE